MSVALLERPARPREHLAPDGGMVARRAVVRWAWRLFRREWRQQLLVLALIVLAVAATIVGAAVSVNSPPPAYSTVGSAQDAATFSEPGPRTASQIASLEQRFGRVDVIDNKTLSVPGSISTYDLRAQDPSGAFGRPLLGLLSGRFPSAADEVALTPGLASEFGVKIGSVWHQGATAGRVVGLVENPTSLLDQFALVVPGQLRTPSQVTVLFDAHGVPPESIGPNVVTRASLAAGNSLNPETISLAGLTIGMILITLVAVGGFTVLAQRRVRSLGMLASLGATDKAVRLVVKANGVVVGVVGAAVGTALGLAAWLAYRPHLEASAHHRIGTWALPWLVIALAVALAVLSTYLAASRPARAITKVPIVAALSGRPAAPRKVRRSAVPGLVLLGIAFFLLGYSGSQQHWGHGGGSLTLVLGLVALLPSVILLAPFCLSVLARLGRRSPIAVRLALRDLARYRARSGSALAAISIGVLIAVIIAIVAAARYSNVLDYVGPNLASNQLLLYTPNSPQGGGAPGSTLAPGQLRSLTASADAIGASLGAPHVIALSTANVDFQYTGNRNGRQWNGTIYVATPQLLRSFGIDPRQLDPNADVLSARPGLAGLSGMELSWCRDLGTPVPAKQGPGAGPDITFQPCLSSGLVRHPVIEEVGALPPGTSAPNTVITQRAVDSLGIQTAPTGWLIQSAQPITGVQIHETQAAAAAAGLTVESKNDQPTSAQVINWATVFGVVLALCILAMSVGLIRSETAADLRTLTATGASSHTRRVLTAATAGGLGVLGAVLGTLAGYVAVIGWLRDNSLNGGIAALGNVPVANLLVILVGMPVLAAAVGWLLAGREPPAIAHQPIE